MSKVPASQATLLRTCYGHQPATAAGCLLTLGSRPLVYAYPPQTSFGSCPRA